MARRQAPAKKKPIPTSGVLGAFVRFIRWSVLITVVFAGAVIGWFAYESDRVVHPGEPSAPVIQVVIPYGTSARGVVSLLKESGLNLKESIFLVLARWEGVQTQLRAGVYLIEPGVTQRQLIQRLARQDAAAIEVRLLEGWTIRQVLEAIAKIPEIRFDVGVYATDRALAEALKLPSDNPEGWIYPDIYIVPKDTTASDLLTRAGQIQQAVVQRAWNERSADLPYRSLYEALIVASIVEKETQYPGDRERVAAVFANRIRLGMPLQADPTVIYGLGASFKGDITRAHLRRDTPFNTYTRKTLPPTPISNPGPRAIAAVMKPADSKALYFVARGDGSSEFSETLQEHNAAVDRFIRRLVTR
jgi:UPF0755 protein